jgi:hypothetical protein
MEKRLSLWMAAWQITRGRLCTAPSTGDSAFPERTRSV